MLDFLWTLRGSIPLDPTASYGGVLDRVAILLEQQNKPPRRVEANVVTFKTPFSSFRRSWKALQIYNEGRFWTEHGLDGRVLRYQLNCLHLLLACALFAVFFAFIAFKAGPGEEDVTLHGAYLLAAVYAANLLVGWFRATRVIRQAVRGR